MDNKKEIEQSLDAIISIALEDSKHYCTGKVYGSKERFEALKIKAQEIK